MRAAELSLPGEFGRELQRLDAPALGFGSQRRWLAAQSYAIEG